MRTNTASRLSIFVTAMLIASTAIACGGSADGSDAPASAQTVPVAVPATTATPAGEAFETHEGEEEAALEGGEGEGDVPASDPSTPPAPPADSDAGTNDAAPAPAAPPAAPEAAPESAPEAAPESAPAPDAPAAAPAPAPASVSALQKLALESARELGAMKVTAYEHTTFVDELSGTFKYDCSGFVGYSLARVLPAQLETVKTFAGVARPLAKHFETFFESIPAGTVKGGWSRVLRAVDVKAGDVVAWLKPADMVSSNTGHVMIARGPAVQSTKRADEILIPITDSTSSPHGSVDSRLAGANGLGTGTIGLIVDASGKPVRYRWTGGSSATEWTTAISLGRPE